MCSHSSDGTFDWEHLDFMLFGLIFHGPGCYMAYTYIDEAVKGTNLRATFTKVGMHVVWRPILMSIMFLYSGWLSGLLPRMAADMWRRSAQEMHSMLLWSLLDFLQFPFVHAKLRVLVLNVIQTIFFVILVRRS
jgi:hypothetical protein